MPLDVAATTDRRQRETRLRAGRGVDGATGRAAEAPPPRRRGRHRPPPRSRPRAPPRRRPDAGTESGRHSEPGAGRHRRVHLELDPAASPSGLSRPAIAERHAAGSRPRRLSACCTLSPSCASTARFGVGEAAVPGRRAGGPATHPRSVAPVSSRHPGPGVGLEGLILPGDGQAELGPQGHPVGGEVVDLLADPADDAVEAEVPPDATGAGAAPSSAGRSAARRTGVGPG